MPAAGGGGIPQPTHGTMKYAIAAMIGLHATIGLWLIVLYQQS